MLQQLDHVVRAGYGGSTAIPSTKLFGDVIADSHGVLYGTTVVGGSSCNNGVSCGVASELVPPAPGKTQWTESVIRVFGRGSDGQMPDGGLVMAPDGALYGETSAGGTQNDGIIYELK